MGDVNAAAESSAAAIEVVEVPQDAQQYAAWRQTGKVPQPKPAESAPAKESSAAGEEPVENPAPGSEPGKKNQEPHRRSGADGRLQELLADLRKAGLTPAELKTYKREAAKAAEPPAQQPAPKATPETAPPKAADPNAPKKPKLEEFKTFDEFEDARDKWVEDMADYKAGQRLERRDAEQKQAAAQQELQAKLAAARTRYADADQVIAPTAAAIFGDAQIPAAVKALLDDSPVVVDLLYVIGSKAEEMGELIELAHSNPGAAIRKLVLLERLVTDELAKGPKAATEETPVRGGDGKFAAAKAETPPEKKVTSAPPPPKEVGGRSSAPTDEVDAALKSGDMRAYREAQNRRDFERVKGH